MKKSKQQSLKNKQDLSFGGDLLKQAHARGPRPLSPSGYLHVVLKSEMAVLSKEADLRLTKRKNEIEEIITGKLADYGAKIHKLAIAPSQIDILITFKSRKKYSNWIRRVTGLIARKMLAAEKGRPSKKSFWTKRPFTRVVIGEKPSEVF